MAKSEKKQRMKVKVGIPPLVGEYEVEWKSTGKDETIIIQSPLNDDNIQPQSGEPYNFARPIAGIVSGFKKDEIAKRQLRVDVSIHTDKWYPQGTVKVQSNGKWLLERGYFGGTVHIVKAELKDKDNRELASAEVVINVK